MKRNIAGLILSGLMVVLLTACGESGANPEGPPETTTLDGVTYSVIAEESDFDKMRSDLEGNYYLWRDIALTGDFEPIGNNSKPFTGIFEGNNKTISKLRIAKSGEDYVGLFGKIGSATPVNPDANGEVRNLTLVLADGSEDDSIIEGANSVGALAGKSYGKIEAVGIEGGFVKGVGSVGGLVGSSDGDIKKSYATGKVTGTNQVGGLVGNASGDIKKSYATGTVTGTNNVGGLVGWAWGTITSSYATGSVTGTNQVGGLVGNASGDITSSYATGKVTGTNQVGGLVGSADGDIKKSYATGLVSTTGTGSNIGGLVGYFYSSNAWNTITSSYFDTSITGTNQTQGGIGNNPDHTGVTGYDWSNGTLQHNGADVMQSDFVDWIFDGDDAVWRWVADGQWPLLAWQ